MSWLNPNYQSIQINLRSDDPAIQGDVSNDTALSFTFNRVLSIPLPYNVNICVTTCEIPHSWYTWDEDMNVTITFAGGGNITILFIKKHWTPCSFISHWNAMMVAAYPAPAVYPKLSFDCSTLKFTITGGTPLTVIFKSTITPFYLDDDNKRMVYRFMGMIQPVILPLQPNFNAPTLASGPTWTSPNCIDTARHHTISVTSIMLNTDSVDSGATDAGEQNVLAKVPVNAPFGSIVTFKGNLNDGYLFKNRQINRIDLALRDHDGHLLKLNGVRYNISLLMQFVKRDPDIIRDIPTAIGTPISGMLPDGTMAGPDLLQKLKDWAARSKSQLARGTGWV